MPISALQSSFTDRISYVISSLMNFPTKQYEQAKRQSAEDTRRIVIRRSNNDNYVQLHWISQRQYDTTKVHRGNTQFHVLWIIASHGSNVRPRNLGNAVTENKALLIIETSFALIRATEYKMSIDWLHILRSNFICVLIELVGLLINGIPQYIIFHVI